MFALMSLIIMVLVILGPAAMTGHPVLIVVGAVLAAAVLVATRRGRGRRNSVSRHPGL